MLFVRNDHPIVVTLYKTHRNNFFNSIVTFILVAAGLYFLICGIFQRNILHPLIPNEDLVQTKDTGQTAISLLVLLFCSVALGWIFTKVRLPALFGALLVGIAFRNIPVLYETFGVDQRWEYMIRLLALACIIIRWGVGLNVDELMKRPILPLSIGIITPIVESAAIAVAGWLLFNMHLSIAIICGLLMAAVSPAVTVPVMLYLKNELLGTGKGVPTTILAASSIDNLFCIGAFSSAVSLVFTDSPVAIAVLWSVSQVLIGIFGGALLGWFFWWFPLPTPTPTSRILLLGTASAASVVGLSVINCATTGIIAAIIFCSLSATRWRKEPDATVVVVERFYGIVWNLICLPLLFALIGLKLVFSELTFSAILAALALIGLGALARLASTFVLSILSLPIKESFFVAMSMVPKATVQAALAPGLLIFAPQFPEVAADLRQTVTACVLTILVTAPLGELILFVLGGRLLTREEDVVDVVIEDVQIKAPANSSGYINDVEE